MRMFRFLSLKSARNRQKWYLKSCSDDARRWCWELSCSLTACRFWWAVVLPTNCWSPASTVPAQTAFSPVTSENMSFIILASWQPRQFSADVISYKQYWYGWRDGQDPSPNPTELWSHIPYKCSTGWKKSFDPSAFTVNTEVFWRLHCLNAVLPSPIKFWKKTLLNIFCCWITDNRLN